MNNEIESLEKEIESLKKHKRRLNDMLPLFQEARDAITAISYSTAKLRGLSLDLDKRMDRVGILEEWEEMDKERENRCMISSYSMRISTYEGSDRIVIEPLKEERFTHHDGMTTLFENIKPEEIVITQEALNYLLNVGQERKGELQFLPNNTIKWVRRMMVPIHLINCTPEAKIWIKKCHVEDSK